MLYANDNVVFRNLSRSAHQPFESTLREPRDKITSEIQVGGKMMHLDVSRVRRHARVSKMDGHSARVRSFFLSLSYVARYDATATDVKSEKRHALCRGTYTNLYAWRGNA